MAEEDPEAGQDEPENVEEEAQRARSTIVDALAERRQPQAGDLEALHAEGHADDGEAEHQARDAVLERDEPAPAEDDPEDVQEQRHGDGDRDNRFVYSSPSSFTATSLAELSVRGTVLPAAGVMLRHGLRLPLRQRAAERAADQREKP